MTELFGLPVVVVLVVVATLTLGMLSLISKLLKFQAHLLILIISGLILGLVISALLSVPLSKLPGLWGEWSPLVASIIVTTITATLLVQRRRGILHYVGTLPHQLLGLTTLRAGLQKETRDGGARRILVDTSVIIDGRILEVARSGFLPGHLLVPRFVLKELQTISDSDDQLKRAKGRRGLDLLATLKKEFHLEVTTEDIPGEDAVDSKLLHLAQRTGYEILTTDYNLNRVAQVEGVRVLNLNELSGALRAAVLPGEELEVEIVQPGKEKKQGVGYLPDGTMIVVEGGDAMIGQTVAVTVTRHLQTVAGKMIFAKPVKNHAQEKTAV
jgi:uncharacterized protein YacL